MLPSETMIWQPEFTDKTLSRKPGAIQFCPFWAGLFFIYQSLSRFIRAIMPCRNAITCCCSYSGNSLLLLSSCSTVRLRGV
ncbi:hypothetical protein DS043_26760 [Escherichia coli]|nr:hypothetical protein [Escherichia coli]HAI9817633.1 hypothetical protein [Escherichia coli]